MKSPRGVVACAMFVIALAGIQLTLDAAGGGSPVAVSGATQLTSDVSPGSRGAHHDVLTEDMSGWDCASMGNGLCAPDEEAVFPGSADPRPLKMAGVEIHKKECPKGADARVKLLKRSAIYGHCSAKSVKQDGAKRPPPKDDGPKEPKEPSTSRGKK